MKQWQVPCRQWPTVGSNGPHDQHPLTALLSVVLPWLAGTGGLRAAKMMVTTTYSLSCLEGSDVFLCYSCSHPLHVIRSQQFSCQMNLCVVRSVKLLIAADRLFHSQLPHCAVCQSWRRSSNR